MGASVYHQTCLEEFGIHASERSLLAVLVALERVDPGAWATRKAIDQVASRCGVVLGASLAPLERKGLVEVDRMQKLPYWYRATPRGVKLLAEFGRMEAA